MLNLNNEYLVINGRDSRDFGIYLIDGNIFDYTIREYESYQVPGRNGDVTIDKGRWKNISVTFKCAAYDNAREKLDMWRAFLLSGMNVIREIEHASTETGTLVPGYHGSYKIETSIEPDLFRIGMISSVSSPELSLQGGGGFVEVTFDCQPQKYLKSGLEPMDITAGVSNLYNPTHYDARPLLKVKAAQVGGKIIFRNYWIDLANNDQIWNTPPLTITINSTTEFYIDCEARDASIERINHNNDVVLSSWEGVTLDFPAIAGSAAIPNVKSYTTISTSDMTSVVMYPKWWTL